uniref:Peptidase domain protein n=1 Tax=Solibacter usitatus (strain Ellin6076) TaxID=234267 RepID=Q01V58_SOLUE
MRPGSIVMLGIGVCLVPLHAQDCAAVARILPAGTVSGTLADGQCQLSDGTPYLPFRLDLPVRGKIKIALTGSSSGSPSDLGLILRDAAGTRIDSGTAIARPIEAGSYTVLLNGSKPGQTGDYNITTAFTAESGMLCGNFPNLGRRQVARGMLPGSNCQAPDGTPYEAYTLTTDGAGTLTVTVDSTDFTPVIAVRSSDGHVIAMPAASPVNVLVNGDSQYLVVISSGDKSGTYTITTSFQAGDTETCRSKKTFTGPDSDTNTIGADSCFLTIAGSGDQSYYNYYNVTVGSSGLVRATVTSGDFNATVNLLDADGYLLASDAGSGGFDAQFNSISGLRAQLPAGNYRLQVFSDVPSGGAYSLQYSFTAGNPKPCTPATLNFGDLPAGTLNADSCRSSYGIADIYTVAVPGWGTVDFDMSTASFNTSLVIRDAKDNLIVRNDEVDGVSDSHITADLPAGTYTIVAAASSGSGNYRLAVKFTPHDALPCTYVQALDLNGGFIQRLGRGSCRASNGQPVDYYSFTLAADSLVLAVMTSSEVDGFLTLTDAAGNVLRTDDNSYGSNDPLIVQYLPAGSYQLAARDSSSTAGGLYEIDLRTTEGARPPFCMPKATMAQGATATGEIRYTGCQYGDNTFADLYQLTLTADGQVDIRLDSSDFDAYLILLDAKGAEMDEDDDSGGNTNARLTRALAAGTYTIVVKPFGDYRDQGKYTLSVK